MSEDTVNTAVAGRHECVVMPELWCVRIPSPDELFATESKEAAENAASAHNVAISKWYETQTELDPAFLPALSNMLAVVEPWPWSARDHAESLAECSGHNGCHNRKP